MTSFIIKIVFIISSKYAYSSSSTIPEMMIIQPPVYGVWDLTKKKPTHKE